MDCSASELDEIIYYKEAELEKLSLEHNVLLESRTCISNSETEALNSLLYSLMTEVNYLKHSEPEIMPKHDAFLYAWAQHSLEEEIKQKEKILYNLDKMQEESYKKKHLLIRSHSNIDDESVNRKMLKDARSKNDLLHCLHRKIVRRLRRLSRRFPTNPKHSEEIHTSNRNETGDVLIRSFYRVIKEFVVELKDRTFTNDNWDTSELVFIDKTYCTEHINILCKANIIQKSNRYHPAYYLITK